MVQKNSLPEKLGDGKLASEALRGVYPITDAVMDKYVVL